jgi:hypothetical protein
MANERIRNSKTHKYIRIRQRTTPNGRKGQIMGAWHPDK